MPRLALFQLLNDARTLRLLPGPIGPSLREDQTTTLAVHLNNLEPHIFADFGLQTLPALILANPSRNSHNLRGGNETANLAKLDDETAPVAAGDGALIHLPAIHHFIRLEPILVQARLIDG